MSKPRQAFKLDVLDNRLERLARDYVSRYIQDGNDPNFMRTRSDILTEIFRRYMRKRINYFERTNKYPEK